LAEQEKKIPKLLGQLTLNKNRHWER